MPDNDEGFAYFQTIEQTFLQLRGKGTLLSPADWEVARRWYDEGVPLDLVRRCMEDAFAGFHDRGIQRRAGARRSIDSLRYCAPRVDAAWEELVELAAAGLGEEAAPLDLPARLAALASALPPETPERAAWEMRIRGLLGDPPTIEAALAALDHDLLQAVAEGMPADELAVLEGEVGKSLSHLAARLPALEVEPVRARLLTQAIRRHRRLPVLSLFSAEAERER
jgi:hypothetical protein